MAALGFFALMRIVAWDTLEPFAVVNALTMVVYLPAWLVAVGAVVARRFLLAGAAVLLIGAQVAYLAPELFSAHALPSWARTAPSIRLLDANVDKSKDFSGGYSPVIERLHPDLLTLEEFTPGSLRALRRSGALAQFSSVCSDPQYGPTGFLVASRLPLTGCRVHTVPFEGRAVPYMVTATLRTHRGSVHLFVVHTLAPFPAYWQEWVRALRAVDTAMRHEATQRVLMVGDFNATWNNRGFATLLSHGLTDAAAARGQALTMTWPNGALLPAFVRIDHLLTGSRLAVTEIETHAGFGSDHRFLSAIVAVRS